MQTIKIDLTLANYIRRAFVPSLEFYRRVVTEKFLPSLSEQAIIEGSNQVEEEAHERMMRGASPEDYDPGDFREQAFDEGLAFYELMHETRQGIVNGFAPVLYHLFEQQLCAFYRLIAEDKKGDLKSGQAAEEKLRFLGFDVAEFPEWASLIHLRLLANCVKHAEGGSCKKLFESRRDLFERPSIGKRIASPRRPVELPLSGEGVYFSAEEFDKMADRVKRFWEWVANESKGLKVK